MKASLPAAKSPRDDQTPLLWVAHFSEQRLKCDQYWLYLNEEEKAWVNRRVTHKLQEEVLISLGLRRQILAELLGVSPQTLIFEYSEQKKPFFANHCIYFNVSHSADFWVMLTDKYHSVGVDVEDTRRPVEFHELSKRFFTTQEADCVQQASNPAEIFWHLWTGKEALLKAIGTGIVEGLDKVEILRNPQNGYDIMNKSYAIEWQLQWQPVWLEHGLVAIATRKATPPCIVHFI